MWTGTPFVRMRVQHLRMKEKFPDWDLARGMPYEDVENIRPETKEMVQSWLKIYGDAKDVILGVEAAETKRIPKRDRFSTSAYG